MSGLHRAEVLDTSIEDAYEHCETLTRTAARNFYYGIRLLPPTKRRALCAVYAVARRIDDIGDGALPDSQKLARLATARDELHALPEHRDDPALRALEHAASWLPIPVGAFDELIDGCEADVAGRSYASMDDLLWYCRSVAGSIGRLSLGVFGSEDHNQAEPLADALGVALQLTNILRDLREDRLSGRRYAPDELCEQTGCQLELDAAGGFSDPPERISALVDALGWQAQRWYDRGLQLLPLLDRRSAACTSAMAGIYHRLLGRLVADPLATADHRVSLPAWEKVAVAAQALVRAA